MLFRCTPHAPAGDVSDAGTSGHRHIVKRDRKHVTVDIHCHLQVQEADALVASAFDPMRSDFIRFASDLTRKLNNEQNESLMPRLTQLPWRLCWLRTLMAHPSAVRIL